MESDMVKYQIGTRTVRVTKDDDAALRDDQIMIGKVYLEIDNYTDIATRVDPRRVVIKSE